ncbi:hypothetical protein E5Q_06292 [Mixia osmundae IAM 14324]|uniref:Uncharacterized protein n=1 Tax=Mixia osmundae (strain CBS 9802 / IAM 14324 / JCM 22182 / KY 12970) TaxID=764103 RepID=G7E8X3_MIXOS|nr:hypothetical protein E5Q_06292 [Mixia osmundae IAM 14324]
MPRTASMTTQASRLPISLSQQEAIQHERQRAIEHYRSLRAGQAHSLHHATLPNIAPA